MSSDSEKPTIESFTLKNYRSFVDPTTIELRPLTLFYGYNHAGKSALLRALALIVESIWGHSTAPLALGASAMRGGYFSDLLSHISGSQELELELLLDFGQRYHLKWAIREFPELRRYCVVRYLVERSYTQRNIKKHTEEDVVDKREADLIIDDLELKKYEVQGYEQIQTREMIFEGLLPNILSPNTLDKRSDNFFIEHLNEIKNDYEITLQWLNSVRQPPLRKNFFKGAPPKFLAPDGQGSAEVLAYSQLAQDPIYAQVSSWYETHLGQNLSVEVHADYFELMLEPHKINIVDAGEGLIQVLPVLVAGALASQGKLNVLTIEEPESHLHPRLHAALADHFCQLAKQKNPPKVVLETHSENFLLRVQLEIAQQKLDPKLVIVYWLRQLSDGRSVVDPITFNTLGEPEGKNLPRGVFSSNIEQRREIIEAQRKYSKK